MDSPEDDDAAAEQLDTVGSIQRAKVTMDYHGALIQLPTMRAAGKQYLLLGYVDLIDLGQGHPLISRYSMQIAD